MTDKHKQPLTDSELDCALDQLSQGLSADNDLWPGIAQQLPQQQTAWYSSMPAVAASVLVGLIGLGLAASSQWQNQQLRTQLAVATSTNITDSSVIPASYVTNQDCQLSDDQRVIEENLAIIDSALKQINNALKTAPNDPALNKRLLDLSKQQVNLINRANAIAL